MSRKNKDKRRETSPSSPNATSGRWLYVVALLIPVLILTAVYFWPENPQQLYREAQKSLEADPARAALLAQSAVEAEGGDFPEAQFLWTQALARQQLWTEALGCFGSIKDTTRCEAYELLELAAAAARARQPLLRRLALEAANRPGPAQGKALQQLVALAFEEQDLETVLPLCEAWGAIEPRNSQPLAASLEVYRRQGEFVKGAEVCREALALPLSADEQRQFRSSLSVMLVELGEVGPARAELALLQREGPLSSELLLANAKLLRLQRKPQEALKEIERLLTQNKNFPGALLTRGVLQLDVGEFDRARQDLERVVKLEPANKEAHYKLAVAWRHLGDEAKATEHFQISTKLTDAAVRALDAPVAD